MSTAPDLLEGETLDGVWSESVRIIQHREGYRFSLDSVLLAEFAAPARGLGVDLGTGSGVVALALLHRSPDAQMLGLELQPLLASRASRASALNGLQGRFGVVLGDIRRPPLLPGRFDFAVSNPPYRPASDGRLSPTSERAIARHEVACALSDVVGAARRLLRDGGRLSMVYPAERLADLLSGLESAALRARRLQLVHPKPGEPARMVLVEAEKGGRSLLTVLPPRVLGE
jgi:tRNA1Val (adenine37-N6)-methyltransferase